jgi:heme-degrading monooxygenase HmoA
MYAVIFRATIEALDEDYARVAGRMRDLAISEYGCLEFVSVTEGGEEVAISYWETEEQILRWKEDPEHLQAQELGRSKWYRSYQVQVVKVVRQ